jgi:hypothetical protein
VAEYVDTVGSCLDCGAELTAGPRPEVEDPALEWNELRTVFIASSPVQGEIVAGVLEAAGIPVFVKGSPLAGAVGELPATVVQVELQVPIERDDEARILTERFERSGDRSDGGAFAGAGQRARGKAERKRERKAED